MSTDVYRFNKDVRITNVTLTTRSNVDINLYNIFSEINIFENLFASTMTGNIAIEDANNIVSFVPFQGEEKIHITFNTPGLEEVVLEFRVYKIGDRVLANDRTQKYVLYFCSEEQIASDLIRLSQKFEGKSSDIVSDVFTEHFTRKPIVTTPSRFSQKGVIPNITPFDFFDWLAGRSIDDTTQGATFLFYEDRDQYNFTSLEQLAAQPSKIEYIYQPSNLSKNTETPETMIRSVDSFKILPAFDVKKQVSEGMYGSTLYIHDITNKTVELVEFNMLDQWQQTNHVEDHEPVMEDQAIAEATKSKVFYYPSHPYAHNNYADSQYSEYWLQARNSQMLQYRQFVLQVSVPGNTDIGVGDVVTFHMPSAQPMVDEKILDRVYEGNYIIGSMRHVIQKDRHEMILELIRDSLPNTLEENTGGVWV